MIYVVISLVFLAMLAASIAVGLLVVRQPSELEAALAPYTVTRPTLARTAVVRRVVEAAEGIARRRGLLQWLEERLARADIQLRAGEVLFFTAAAAVLAGIVALVALPFTLVPMVTIAIGATPVGAIVMAGARRRRRFAAQLPDSLTLLAGTLRAGYSLHQGLDAVSREVAEPMGAETRRVLAETRLGRELEQALGDCAVRMGSDDLGWAVLALGIQREAGGNLAELLDTVADTMVQRQRLRRDVSALTAEGRMSAIVLGILPPGLGLVLSVINPGYVGRLFEDLVGQAMVVASAVIALLGFIWMKKIIDIEI